MTLRLKPNNSLAANINFICGITGAGKSSLMKSLLAKHKRVIVNDVKNEYPYKKIYTIAELLAAVKKTKGPGRFAYVGPHNRKTFEYVCRIAFAWMDCALVAEELSFNNMTTSSKAPPSWHMCITQGRGFGVSIYGTTTRPQEIDKTIIANSNKKYCFMLERAKDRSYMAEELAINVEQIPTRNYDYLQKENGKVIKRRTKK